MNYGQIQEELKMLEIPKRCSKIQKMVEKYGQIEEEVQNQENAKKNTENLGNARKSIKCPLSARKSRNSQIMLTIQKLQKIENARKSKKYWEMLENL